LTAAGKWYIVSVLSTLVQKIHKGVECIIFIDYKDPRPIYEQITERIERLVLRGVLKADEQLPSVRQLALDLSINPNTIQKAFSELEKKGVIYSRKGKGNFVSWDDGSLRNAYRKLLFDRMHELIVQAKELGVSFEELTLECGRWYHISGEGETK
jgi:GntR family transcriptional regulator